VWTLIMTQEFALAHPQAIPAGELARLKKLCAEADAEYGLLATAAQRVRTRASLSPLAWLSIVGTCFGAVAPSAVAVLLAAVALSWALRRWLFPAGPEAGGKLGPVRHVLAWTLGYGLTFVLFGMAPAEVIPRAVQEWTLTAVAVLGAVAFGVWLVARTRGRKGPARWQFSIRAMLGATFVVAAVLGSLMWLGVDLSHPEQLRVP